MPRTASARLIFLIVLVTLSLARPVAAQEIETRAREAYVYDMSSGTVLYEHNAHERMPTASMSKIMTMYMVFEALEDGRLSLDDEITVSERAWRMEGSRMFIEVGERVPVEDLIRGVIIQSGNDASVALAEALGGTEAEFARMMTERAHELGMTDSNFMNATGWPHPDHYSTAADLALLAEHLIDDYPQYYHYYSELEFTWNDITQGNRNPLLYRDIGADGLKTGHTEDAGYGLTASAVRGERRVIVVVNGLDSAQERADEAARLTEWAFREFDTFNLFQSGETVAEAIVWQGEPARVPMVLADNFIMTLRRGQVDEVEASVRVMEPLPTPIAAGDPIGELVIDAPGMPEHTVDLLAGADVQRQGFVGRVFSGLGHMLTSVVN